MPCHVRGVTEPLKERAIGKRVQVYFPGHEKSHRGEVTGYDAETEYYRVRCFGNDPQHRGHLKQVGNADDMCPRPVHTFLCVAGFSMNVCKRPTG